MKDNLAERARERMHGLAESLGNLLMEAFHYLALFAIGGITAWASVVALGVLCTGVAYVLYFRLIEALGPARALTVTFTVPVFAIVYGSTLLGEAVTPWMLVCGAIVLCGTALATGLVKLRI